jgi:hypothetical protein
VNDRDAALAVRLEQLVPVPNRQRDWADVVERARPRLRRRPLVLALAAALLMLATAAGVTAALGGFDAWLNGEPGKPAPRAEQARFEAANVRSWAAFPKDTKLRELIRTTVAGKTYVLFGFRSGNSLCLKLKGVSLGHSTEIGCAAATTVAHVTAPIVVVNANGAFYDRHNHESAEVSYGIAADGVSGVTIDAPDGQHRVIVRSNAYLWVEDEPNTGNHVLAIRAVGGDGREKTVHVADPAAMFGPLPGGGRAGPPPGPTRVERTIRRPTIGWYARGEKRGFPGGGGGVRAVKPDPLAAFAVGLSGRYCLVTYEGSDSPFGRSCSRGAAEFFARGPMNVTLEGSGSSRFELLAGAAADGVDRIKAFLEDGEVLNVPLRDNLFGTLVPAPQLPARIVAYDARRRVVGIQVFPPLRLVLVPERALRHLRAVARVRARNAVTAVLRVGHSVRGIRCWRVDFSTGQRRGGCVPLDTGPYVEVGLVQPAGDNVFVIGDVRVPIEKVELRFADGRRIFVTPVAEQFVVPIPGRELRPGRQLAFAFGERKDGTVVQRSGFLFKYP